MNNVGGVGGTGGPSGTGGVSASSPTQLRQQAIVDRAKALISHLRLAALRENPPLISSDQEVSFTLSISDGQVSLSVVPPDLESLPAFSTITSGLASMAGTLNLNSMETKFVRIPAV